MTYRFINKLLLISLVFISVAALAQNQFSGITTGTAPTTDALTQPTYNKTTSIANGAMIYSYQQQFNGTLTMALGGSAGGQLSFASLGAGGQIVPFTSTGTISNILSVVTPGANYAIGDLLCVVAGNRDAVIQVTSVGAGGGLQTAGIIVVYGGTGYTTGGTIALLNADPLFRNTLMLSGTLTSALSIVLPNGTLLTGGKHLVVYNNTTGAFITTFSISNGSNAPTGPGAIVPQGIANSLGTRITTDGVTGVWPD